MITFFQRLTLALIGSFLSIATGCYIFFSPHYSSSLLRTSSCISPSSLLIHHSKPAVFFLFISYESRHNSRKTYFVFAVHLKRLILVKTIKVSDFIIWKKKNFLWIPSGLVLNSIWIGEASLNLSETGFSVRTMNDWFIALFTFLSNWRESFSPTPLQFCELVPYFFGERYQL